MFFAFMSDFSYYKNISIKTKILNTIRKVLRNKFCEQFFIRKNISSEGKSKWLKLIPQEYLYAKGSLRYYERNGERFELDISNVIDHAKYFGYGEKGLQNLEEKIKENFIIVDVGANIGTMTVRFAKLASLGKIIAFEPSLQTYNRLIKHIEINNLTNIIAVNQGVGYKSGAFKLYKVVETNPGMNRILPNNLSDEVLEFEYISVSTLEKELEKLQVKKVDLIKIDVEGYEYQVLKGAEKILDLYKPMLFIELDDFNLKQNASSALEVVNFLMDKNYSIKGAESLEDISKSYRFNNCHLDIICEHKEAEV